MFPSQNKEIEPSIESGVLPLTFPLSFFSRFLDQHGSNPLHTSFQNDFQTTPSDSSSPAGRVGEDLGIYKDGVGESGGGSGERHRFI